MRKLGTLLVISVSIAPAACSSDSSVEGERDSGAPVGGGSGSGGSAGTTSSGGSSGSGGSETSGGSSGAPDGGSGSSGSPSGVGTGTSYAPTYIMNVTGGGPMPSWTTNVVTAACAGDGVTDDTACLQDAANAARDQVKPLVIPYTDNFYRVSDYITIYGSVGGVGGMPTIKRLDWNNIYSPDNFHLADNMTGWIYNLHLVGPYDGVTRVSEWQHNIAMGQQSGVTIKGNILENPQGDCISNSEFNHPANNVLIDGNSCINPYRCGIAFVGAADGWVIINNRIDKNNAVDAGASYVSGIDFEPELQEYVQNVEVAFNLFVMNNRTVNPDRGADGKAVFGWRVPSNPSPGGNFYIHHNYGTFGTGFGGDPSAWNGGWGDVFQSANEEGSSVPN
jgi:hypothetical protein